MEPSFGSPGTTRDWLYPTESVAVAAFEDIVSSNSLTGWICLSIVNLHICRVYCRIRLQAGLRSWMVSLGFSSGGIGHVVRIDGFQVRVIGTCVSVEPGTGRLSGGVRSEQPRNKWDSCPLFCFLGQGLRVGRLGNVQLTGQPHRPVGTKLIELRSTGPNH